MSTPILTFQVSPGQDIEFPLNADSVTLGRAPSNTIVIQNSWISTKHALFARQESGEFEILDLGSHNGIEVNGERITRRLLRDGDKIAFGQIEARFQDPDRAEGQGARIPVPVETALTTDRGALENQVGRLRIEHLSLSSEIAKLREVKKQLSEAAHIEVTIGRLQEKLDALQEEIAESAAVRDELAGETDETKRSLEAYENEVVRCRNEIACARETLAEIESNKGPVASALATGQKKLASLRAEIADTENRRTALETEQVAVEARTQELREELETLAAAVRQTGGEKEAAEAELAPLRAQVAETRSGLDALQTSREKAEAELETLNPLITSLRSDFDALRNARDSAQSDCSELRATAKAMESRVADLKEQKETLEAAQDLEWGTVHVFSKFLIRRIDLLDDLLKSVIASSEDTALVDQLIALRESLLDILREHSVEPFHFPEGTPIDISTRKRILIIGGITKTGSNSGKDGKDGKEIAATIRPGYFCSNGDLGSETLLRKAEVKIA